MSKICKTIVFSGIVQGVGFRYNALQAAREFDVTGTIANLADGSVRMEVEGLPSEIDRLVARMIATTRGRVTDQSEIVEPATGRFREFSILRR